MPENSQDTLLVNEQFVAPEVIQQPLSARELLYDAREMENRILYEAGSVDETIIGEAKQNKTLMKGWNDVLKHANSGTLEEIGIDTSRANLTMVIGAIVSGETPVTIELMGDQRFTGNTERIFESMATDRPNVTVATELEAEPKREEVLHLSIITPGEVQKYEQLLAMLENVGINTTNYQAIVIDHDKLHPMLAVKALSIKMQQAIQEIQDDLLFSIIQDEGLDTHEVGSVVKAAKIVAQRVDKLDDAQLDQMLPEMIKAVLSQGEESKELFSFCDKLYSKYGEALFESDKFDKLWQNPQFLRLVGYGYINYQEASSQKDKLSKSEVAIKFRDKMLASLGMDEKQKQETLAAWNARSKDWGKGLSARREVTAMTELITHQPDAVRELFKEFGICNFSRYDTTQLLSQLRDREEGRVAEFVTFVVTARDDWNGGLASFPRELYKNEQSTTPPGVDEQIIFVEASSTAGMLRELVSVARHAKAVNRIVVAAHGNKKLMHFGKDEITIDMVQSSVGATRLKERGILEDDTEIILKSCSVGKKGGIAQTIARRVGVDVLGATKNSGAKSLIKKPRRWMFWKSKSEREKGAHYISWGVKVNKFNPKGEKVDTIREHEF
jgi:hypothetical protein